MNINLILELLRDSLMGVLDIKNAVMGNIYSSYIDNTSEFPCITLFFIAGSSPVPDDAIYAPVQAKIWTDNADNPYDLLYGIYADIYDNFKQNHKSNDNLKMGCTMKGEHPPVILEKYNNLNLYSLAAKIHCRAIYA